MTSARFHPVFYPELRSLSSSAFCRILFSPVKTSAATKCRFSKLPTEVVGKTGISSQTIIYLCSSQCTPRNHHVVRPYSPSWLLPCFAAGIQTAGRIQITFQPTRRLNTDSSTGKHPTVSIRVFLPSITTPSSLSVPQAAIFRQRTIGKIQPQYINRQQLQFFIYRTGISEVCIQSQLCFSLGFGNPAK